MSRPSGLLPFLFLGAAAVSRQAPPTAVLEGRVYAPNVRPAGGVVYLVAEGAPEPPPLPTAGVIDQLNLRFVPRVLVVTPGSTVRFLNSDPILHNVFSPGGPGPGFDLGTYPRRDSRTHTFDDAGAHVILCHVHPEMYAYVLVVPTRLFGLTDGEGDFRIPEIPAGRYTLHIWHPDAQEFHQPILIRDGERRRVRFELSRRR
ncbi:MAG: hypothetical protein ACE5HP_11665 [Gemmatimonadota bacterium]